MSRFDKDSIGKRMKSYEEVTRTRLIPRESFIIRLDGRAFHTYTKGFDRPFDKILVDAMQNTMLYLCENLSNCIFGYTQSDEITLVFTIKDPIKGQGLFDYEVQKLVSISASMATKIFNKEIYESYRKMSNLYYEPDFNVKYYENLEKKLFQAEFDSRVFNIPSFEIINNIIWRQQDCVRNSINSLGFANFSQKQLQGKNCEQIQDMLIEKGINWNNLKTNLKRGSCCYRKRKIIKTPNNDKVEREKFIIDEEMPIISSDEGRKWFNEILNQGGVE